LTLPKELVGESEEFIPVECVQDKVKGHSPFDFIKSINGPATDNMMRDTENDDLAEKAYVPWVVNIGLSYFPDTILHANLMNMYPDLDHRPQYEFLLNSIRPRKRYSKWIKNTSAENLELVCKHYECNKVVGGEYLSLLDDEQIKYIKTLHDEGGTTS